MIPDVEPMQQSNFPGIFALNTPIPIVSSPNAPYDLFFAQTRDTLEDVELYKKFLTAAIRQFRGSKRYKHYKAHLMDELGLDCCQYHSNIHSGGEESNEEMATIEMHHHILTIFDIAHIITEHVINNGGCLTTFDLASLLGVEHVEHRVATVMLCKTCHQLQHNEPTFFLPSSMAFGNWVEFLQRYKDGVGIDTFQKINGQLKKEMYYSESNEKQTRQLLSIANTLENWSEHNAKMFGISGLDQ